LDVIDYVASNRERFDENASAASLEFIEQFEDLQDMGEEFEDPVLEFRGPASGVHLDEVNSLATDPGIVEPYGELTLEFELPENSTYSMNGQRAPGVIPMEFVNTVYGPQETIEVLEQDFGNEYGIEYSELSLIKM